MELRRPIGTLAGSALLALLVFVISMVATTQSTFAAGAIVVGGKAVVTNTQGSNIRLREGAGTSNKQVAESHQGEVVGILAGPSKDAKGNAWYRIDAPGGKGWILSDFLAAKSAPIVQAPAAPRLVEFARVTNTDGDNLRVRADPSRKGSVLTTLAPNTVMVIEKGPVLDSDKTSWYQVLVNGRTGWAMAQYLAQAEAPAKAIAQKVAQPADDVRSGTSRGVQPATQASSSSLAVGIVGLAMKFIGYRYRFGGSSPSGFDCSGFLSYVVNHAGKAIGRDMYSQLNSGTRVSSNNLQPGDLLFFSNTYKRGLSHAAIYIGNGKMIHAENESTGVTISSVWSAYWGSHYTAAVRVR